MSNDWYDCKTCGGRHNDADYRDVCPGSALDRLDAIEERLRVVEEQFATLYTALLPPAREP